MINTIKIFLLSTIVLTLSIQIQAADESNSKTKSEGAVATVELNTLEKLDTLSEGDEVTKGAILIENATIHTLGSQGLLKDASLLIKNGKIVTIGIGVPVPESATVIDAAGREITPGLMNAKTALGLVEVSAIKSTVDSGISNKNYSSSFSIADVINPDSTLIAHNRINGLTRAMVVPSNDKALFQGKGSLIKLSRGFEPVVIKDNAAYLNYGVKGATVASGSRALALLQIKEAFEDAKKYADKPDGFKAESSLKKRDVRALLPVLKGDIPLVVSVHRASDILTMIALKEEYSIKMILSGAEEGWMVADKIAAANISVMINPYANLPSNFEKIANRIDLATLLHEAGVEIILTNFSSHNAYVIRHLAGNAVAYGLPRDIALAAISSTPAKWFGLANHYGTLEAGMDADLVIWDGDPLEVTTSADRVFIQGEEVEMVSRQTRLRDRYMEKTSLPAGYSK